MDLPLSASKHKSLGIAAMIRPSDNGLLPPVNHKSELLIAVGCIVNQFCMDCYESRT